MIAEYTKGLGKRYKQSEPDAVEFKLFPGGPVRQIVYLSGKAAARRLCKSLNATPYNF